MLLDHLAEAERQLAELAARVERQWALVQGLEAVGQETAHAAFLLQQAIGLKALHEALRDWLKRELTKCDEPHPPHSAARFVQLVSRPFERVISTMPYASSLP